MHTRTLTSPSLRRRSLSPPDTTFHIHPCQDVERILAPMKRASMDQLPSGKPFESRFGSGFGSPPGIADGLESKDQLPGCKRGSRDQLPGTGTPPGIADGLEPMKRGSMDQLPGSFRSESGSKSPPSMAPRTMAPRVSSPGIADGLAERRSESGSKSPPGIAQPMRGSKHQQPSPPGSTHGHTEWRPESGSSGSESGSERAVDRHGAAGSGRGTARAEDAQGTPTQSPSILVYEDNHTRRRSMPQPASPLHHRSL